MNITKKIIITDTNIITDLNNAKILGDFVNLDNVYITNLVKRYEINSNTCDIEIINNMKTINVSSDQLLESIEITRQKHSLSSYDAINYVVAKDNKCILATGDKALKKYSEEHGIEVIRTLKIIKLMEKYNIISSRKAVKACKLLKENISTRIPLKDIDNLIKEMEVKR